MLNHADEAHIENVHRIDVVNADDGLKERFDAGDFTGVARVGAEDDWRTHAARGLIGLRDRAIEGLQRFDHREARFYSAVADWIDGRNDDAARGLEGIDLPHARNLLALLRKPRIEVLTQMSSTRPFSLLQGIEKDLTFSVHNIGFNAQDLPTYPYADVQRFYDRGAPPDFYFCTKPEWFAIPPNLQELPCPLIGQTADWDMLAQTTYPWLQLFDEIMMTGSGEHEHLVKLVDVPVTCFPKPNGVPTRLLPEIPGPDMEREIDLIMTGSSIFSYYDDKARMLSALRQIDGLKTFILNGFVGDHHYWNLYGRSVMCLSYTRRQDGFPTRALESLAMGCVSIAQRDNTLEFYIGEDEGMVIYDSDDPRTLVDAVERVLAEPKKYLERARRGARLIREQFSEARAASEMFRFATFLAARPRAGGRKAVDTEGLLHKRPYLWKGWFPRFSQLQEIRDKKTLERSISRVFDVPSNEVTASRINDTARDLMIQFVGELREAHNVPPHAEGYLTRALDIYRSGLVDFPNSLVLRFNFIRACIHFGSLTAIQEAVSIANDTLNAPESKWQIDAEDDIFPWDYLNEVFDYRSYLDAYIRLKQGDEQAKKSLKRLIIGALHFYLSQVFDDLKHLEDSVQLSPNFFQYKLTLAKRLLRTGDPESVRRAVEISRDLVQTSDVFVNATQLLRIAKTVDADIDVGDLERYERQVREAARRHIFFEESGIRINSFYYRAMHFNRPEIRKESVFRSATAPKAPQVSVVLVHEPGYDSSAALESLLQQDLPRSSYEIIWVEPFDVLHPIHDQVDVILARRQSVPMHQLLDCFNGALTVTRGSVIVFCEAVREFPTDFVSKMRNSVEQSGFKEKQGPRISIVANDGDPTNGDGGGDKMPRPSGAVSAYMRARSVIGSCLAVHRSDVFNVKGFDNHLAFSGSLGPPVDIARRLASIGLQIVDWGSSEACPKVRFFGYEKRYDLAPVRDILEGHFEQTPITPLIGSPEVHDRIAELERQKNTSFGVRMP